jgi:hypothetical protein
MKLMRLYK